MYHFAPLDIFCKLKTPFWDSILYNLRVHGALFSAKQTFNAATLPWRPDDCLIPHGQSIISAQLILEIIRTSVWSILSYWEASNFFVFCFFLRSLRVVIQKLDWLIFGLLWPPTLPCTIDVFEGFLKLWWRKMYILLTIHKPPNHFI